MVRLGAIDYDNGEASPVMFGGWPLLLESISSCHPDHARNSVPEFFFCPSYLRIINLTNGLTVSNISGSCNHTFGSAMVVPAGDGRPETMYVFATRYARFQTPNAWCPRPTVKTSFGSECQNATTCVIDAWSSTDQSLQKWTKTPALKPGFKAFNTDVVKLPPGEFSLGGVGPVSYVMAVEHPGGPNGWSSTIFATNATVPMSGWVSVPHALPGAQDATVACPCIRYEDRKFYVMGAARFINGIQSVELLRSADLKTWEPAKRTLVSPDRSKGSPELRPIAAADLGLMTWQPAVEFPKNGRFASVSTAFFKGGWNVAASDLDAVEIEGGYFKHARGNKSVLVHWCLNDQHRWGFGELGLFDGSMAEWLQAPYDHVPTPPAPHHASSVSTPITDYWQETSEPGSGKAIASAPAIKSDDGAIKGPTLSLSGFNNPLQTPLQFTPSTRHLVNSASPTQTWLAPPSISWVPWVVVASNPPEPGGEGGYNVDSDAGRAAFLRDFDPDVIDWTGGMAFNRADFARLRGIASSSAYEFEYEESLQFTANETLSAFEYDGMSHNLGRTLHLPTCIQRQQRTTCYTRKLHIFSYIAT